MHGKSKCRGNGQKCHGLAALKRNALCQGTAVSEPRGRCKRPGVLELPANTRDLLAAWMPEWGGRRCAQLSTFFMAAYLLAAIYN